MSDYNKKEFNIVVEDILSNQQFRKMDRELHHGITRLKHSIRVAKISYVLSKFFNADYINATRAALMHDFYIDSDFKGVRKTKVFKTHGTKAAMNAKINFNITDIEENIIKSHMFPISEELPRYKEAWIVSIVDKFISIYEMFRFKSVFYANVFLILTFNYFGILI